MRETRKELKRNYMEEFWEETGNEKSKYMEGIRNIAIFSVSSIPFA